LTSDAGFKLKDQFSIYLLKKSGFFLFHQAVELIWFGILDLDFARIGADHWRIILSHSGIFLLWLVNSSDFWLVACWLLVKFWSDPCTLEFISELRGLRVYLEVNLVPQGHSDAWLKFLETLRLLVASSELNWTYLMPKWLRVVLRSQIDLGSIWSTTLMTKSYFINSKLRKIRKFVTNRNYRNFLQNEKVRGQKR
jgi:hypothetical protein